MKLMRFSEMKLKKKLIISLLSFVLLPMVLFSMLFLFLTLTNEINNLGRIQEKENLKSVQKLESLFDYSDTMYSNLLYEYYIGFFIDDMASMSQYYELSKYFDDLLERYPYYVNFVIYNDQGINYQRGLLLDDVSNNMMAKDGLVAHTGWTKPHRMLVSTIYDFQGMDVVTYSYELAKYNKSGKEVYGIFEINFHPELLYEEVFNRTDSVNEAIYLLDQDGSIMLGPQTGSFGKPIENYDQLKLSLNKEKGMFYTSFSNKRQLCYFQSVDQGAFYILRFVSIGELIKMHSSVLLVVLFMAILFLGFAFLFSRIQNKHIIDPLAEISGELKKIEQGNFSIELSLYSEDEIGNLASRVLKMSQRLESLIQENYVRKIKEQEAELNALVTQINPHFLYNTLDSIHWMAIAEKNYTVSQQIEALSSMFRHILNKGSKTIRILDEIEFLESYFLIMNKRYNDSVELYIEIDEEMHEEIRNHTILKLLIQPLVENAFTHGLKATMKNGMIMIRFYCMDQDLYIEVEDNGLGIDPDILKDQDKLSNEYSALKNIQERLQLYYGCDYGMHIEGKKGKGTCIILKLPFLENMEGETNHENDDHR